jgi:hypothetical protein
MAAVTRFYNITGSTGVTVQLLAPSVINPSIRSVLFTNTHASADATITLLIQNDPVSGTTSTFNILHTISIPASTSLSFDTPTLAKYPQGYGLYVTVGATDTLDVLLNL